MTGLDVALAALRARLQTVPGLPTVVWHNRRTASEPTTPFVAEEVLGVDDGLAALGPDWTRTRITWSLLLHTAPGTGSFASWALVGAISAALWGAPITDTLGRVLWVRQVRSNPPLLVGAWWAVPVTVVVEVDSQV